MSEVSSLRGVLGRGPELSTLVRETLLSRSSAAILLAVASLLTDVTARTTGLSADTGVSGGNIIGFGLIL